MAKAYFLKGNQYLRYQIGGGADAGYPKQIANGWTGIGDAGWDSGIDAALDIGNGKAYLFRGPDYVRLDQGAPALDAGYPKSISGNWPGLAEAGFGEALSAVAYLGDDTALFFKDNQCIAYRTTTNPQHNEGTSGAASAIADEIPALTQVLMPDGTPFSDGIDGALESGTGKLYVFKGDQYASLDTASLTLDAGYPLAIGSQWVGLGAAGFGADLDAVWRKIDALVPTGTGSGVGGGSADIPDDFFPALRDMCTRLGCAPVDMLGVMMSESDVMATAQNKKSKASGLIQIMPENLPGVGWPGGPDAFIQLSATQQLPYVEKYFSPWKSVGLGSTGALYGVTYLPGRLKDRGSSPETVLTDSSENLYNAGLDIDKDGNITVGDLTARVANVQRGSRWDSIIARLNAS